MRVGIYRPPPVQNRILRGPAESAAATFDSFLGRFAPRSGGDADADGRPRFVIPMNELVINVAFPASGRVVVFVLFFRYYAYRAYVELTVLLLHARTSLSLKASVVMLSEENLICSTIT